MERGALLQKFATLIDENSETLAHLLTAEGGKLLPESRIFAALLLRHAAEGPRGRDPARREPRRTDLDSARALWGGRRHHRLELPRGPVRPQGWPRARH